MRIKSIVLEGFKSYGNRVEITGFDPEFNAITGLNGTGKSNILDAICFVLGISNLSNVRAGNLQDLIYKQGQAGITKATVSITFDNTDKNNQPVGFGGPELTVTRQVVMGGKNRYLINGLNVQLKRVNDMFCSVQLNVNNPHFLIMQGRITKVLNMKPPEILSMVEEAAGTRMYEAKKLSAQRTIEKKDAKLRELNDLIRDEITPKLNKLKEEKAQFQEYQKVVRELENLTKLDAVWKYMSAEENTKKAEANVQEVREAIQEKKNSIKKNEEEIKAIEKSIAEINKQLDEEHGGALAALEAQLQRLDRAEAAAGAGRRAAADALHSHEQRQRLLRRAADDDQALLAARRRQLDQESSSFASLREASEAAERALVEAQERFLAVSAGRETASESLQDQLMAAKQEESEAATRVLQSGMELRHAEQRLRALAADSGAAARLRADRAAVAQHQAQIDQIQDKLSRLNFDEERNAELKESTRSLQTQIRRERDAVDSAAARLQRCRFHYQPPHGFDTRRVCGTVCELVSVHEPAYCVALDAVAGGKLYNVVVDTEVTSKLLLQKGNLQTRTIIIPLNKISAQAVDRRTVQLAQEIGGGPEHVQLALDLVAFEPHLLPAMRWVFGGTLVCRDLDTAKRVTFHPRVRRRCVTWDGDVCDPAGTLSGGARQQGGAVLAALQALRAREAALARAEAEAAAVAAELQAQQRVFDEYHTLQQRHEVMSHELAAVEARLALSAHAEQHLEAEALRLQVTELKAGIERDKIIEKEAGARARELEAKVKDIRNHREREFKKAEEALKKAKKDALHHGESWKNRSEGLETLRLEAAELEAALADSARQLADGELAATALAQELQAADAAHAAAAEEVSQMQQRISRQKAEMSSRSGAARRLQAQREQLGAAARAADQAAKEMDYKAKELQDEADAARKRMVALERAHPWLAAECAAGGAGAARAAARGAGDAARLRALAERRAGLERGLNARAHTLLGSEEEKFKDLVRKRNIVEADRAKLVQVMAELDEKKRSTLAAAVQRVNEGFGSIFSTLLPGAAAALRPPPGQGVLDGLEVMVGFNGTWKEALSELSGGQRSLVAMSLVLAMLLFRPAPLYILDEVDAALDLSHTQNIGTMLRTHFQRSQFIIVSLKDGMFNNANVLFRTKFVDGMSAVTRTTARR